MMLLTHFRPMFPFYAHWGKIGLKWVKSIKVKFQHFCTSKGFSFNGNDVNKSCLNKAKLCLNKWGSCLSDNSFKKYVNPLWTLDAFAKIYQHTHEHTTNSLVELKSLEIRNHNYYFFIWSIDLIRNKFDNLPVGIYLLQVNNRNTRTKCEICSKLTRLQNDGVIIEHILSPCSSVSIVNFEHAMAGCA